MDHTACVNALAKREVSCMCRALELTAPTRRLQYANSYERGMDGQTDANACCLSLHYSTLHYISNIHLIFTLTHNCLRPVDSAPQAVLVIPIFLSGSFQPYYISA